MKQKRAEENLVEIDVESNDKADEDKENKKSEKCTCKM
jgi:hypothetical protein